MYTGGYFFPGHSVYTHFSTQLAALSLCIKLSDAVDCSERREMIRGNRSNSNSDSDGVS